jgi:hypothetical protein
MKILTATLCFVVISMSCSAQKLDGTKVPQTVKDAFHKAHPAGKASWEKEDADYEANFTENGKSMSCVINAQGTILETESPITVSELPAMARTYVNEHYKGKKWKEVAKIVKADGTINYELNAGGTEVLFDANGNHIEKKKEKEKD